MNEQGAAADHLRDTLVNSEAVGALVGDRIHYGAIPRGAVFPCVLYLPANSQDRLAAGGARMLVRTRWLVRVVHNQNDMIRIRAIAAVVDAALVGTTATVELDGQSYYVQSVVRREAYEAVGQKDGTIYINAGGYYQTTAYSVP